MEVHLRPAMTRAEMFDLLRFYRGEDQHENNLLNGRMNWYLTSQSFMVLAVCITETGPYKWLQLGIPTLVSILGMTLTINIKMAIDVGCETVSRWKRPQALVWNRLSPYLIRRRYRMESTSLPRPLSPPGKGEQEASTEVRLERIDLVQEESMLFLYKTPELFYMTWSILGGLCLCNNPLLAGHVAAKAAIAAVWFGASGAIGYSRLRRTTPRPDFHWPASGKLLEWRDRHTISSIVPSLGENACKALIQASGADLPRQYVDLMGVCDGLVIDNCHIFGLSDIRDSLQIDGISFYQLAEIADLGGLYARQPATAGPGTAYLIRDDGASGGYVATEESGDFYTVVERHLCPSLMKRFSKIER